MPGHPNGWPGGFALWGYLDFGIESISLGEVKVEKTCYYHRMKQNRKVIDLTHTISGIVPAWDGRPVFELTTLVDYKDCVPPNLFRIQKLTTGMSVGTHLDAPAHVIPGGRTIDQITPEELVSECVVIDVSGDANEKYLLDTAAVEKFEREHGIIPANSLVIVYTGWSKRWEKPEEYHNNHVFPGVGLPAAELLLRRNIRGIGIDTFSCDTGQDGFPVHQAVLGDDKYLVENICNADLLPATGAKVFVLPMKVKNATEAPLRLVGILG